MFWTFSDKEPWLMCVVDNKTLQRLNKLSWKQKPLVLPGFHFPVLFTGGWAFQNTPNFRYMHTHYRACVCICTAHTHTNAYAYTHTHTHTHTHKMHTPACTHTRTLVGIWKGGQAFPKTPPLVCLCTLDQSLPSPAGRGLSCPPGLGRCPGHSLMSFIFTFSERNEH